MLFYFNQYENNTFIIETLELKGSEKDGDILFKMNCVGCHGITARGLVGPDLHSITNRLSDSEIINFSEMPFRRIRFHVGLLYETTPETIMSIRKDIESYIEKNTNLVDADQVQSTIRVTDFNDSSIDVLVNCFTKSTQWHDYCVAREELIMEIMRIVKNNGSDFAYPTRTIHLEKD